VGGKMAVRVKVRARKKNRNTFLKNEENNEK
jgi:hypothetical protein